MANLNIYVPGRPNYIYVDGVCYRKTEERTYDGTIYDVDDVDSTSMTASEHVNTGKAVWVRPSCEECQTPGGIEMWTVDTIGSSLVVTPDVHSLDLGWISDGGFYSMQPYLSGGGVRASVSTEQIADFDEIFGAVAPVIADGVGSGVGFTDPLSAADGLYSMVGRVDSTVQVALTGDVTYLPGHPLYEPDPNEEIPQYSIGNLPSGHGVRVSAQVAVITVDGIPYDMDVYSPSPVGPAIHPDKQEEMVYAIGLPPVMQTRNEQVYPPVRSIVRVWKVGDGAEHTGADGTRRYEGGSSVDGGRVILSGSGDDAVFSNGLQDETSGTAWETLP